MPKTYQQSTTTKKRCFYGIRPWSAAHYDGYSEISAYVEASGNIENIMTVRATSGASAEAIAEFALDLINDHQRNQHLLRDAIAALEAVMDDGLDFSSEQNLEKNIQKLKRQIG
ncbi:MAG: hypothetical protein WAO98_07985 [Alphaproteobacteria bacterium]